ncbi:hypothetical protein SLE2022_338470 [Rubroshorea leprosula]
MCSYIPNFHIFNGTKGGLIQLNHGKLRPLQHVVNAAFLASLYSDYLDAAGTKGWFCGPNFFSTDILREFAKTQIDYIQQPSKNELCGGIWQPVSKTCAPQRRIDRSLMIR